MRFMNRWEVEEAVARYLGHPVLGPATETLRNLMLWTDRNSDGWAYWPKPTRAAERLMELIQPDGQDWRYDEDRTDATELAYRKALRAIKTFRTRQNADFEIVEVRRETCEECGQPDNCGDCTHEPANPMRSYEVTWTIEVDGASFDEAAAFVDNLYLVPAEFIPEGWTYTVTDRETGEQRNVRVAPGVTA